MQNRIPKRDLEAMYQRPIESMSEEQLDAELRSYGLGPDAVIQHGFQRVCEALCEVSKQRRVLLDALTYIYRHADERLTNEELEAAEKAIRDAGFQVPS